MERLWRVLGTIGTVRAVLLLGVFGVLYLAMGNTLGRAVGALLLVAAAWVTWRWARSSSG